MKRREGVSAPAVANETKRADDPYLSEMVEAAIEDYCETGDLEGVITLLRAGLSSQELLDIAAFELEAVSRQPRRADKVRAARRKWERNWDINYNMSGNSLLGRPESRAMRVSDVALDLADRHGMGSERQIWEIYRSISERTGHKRGRKK